MNRREFINSITAAAATTAMPMPSIAMRGASPVVPAAAKHWASYMTQLHGTCTPGMLSTMINVEVGAAKGMLQTLIHQGYLRPVQIVAPQTGANTLAQANQKIGDAVKRVVSADDDAANEDDAANDDSRGDIGADDLPATEEPDALLNADDQA